MEQLDPVLPEGSVCSVRSFFSAGIETDLARGEKSKYPGVIWRWILERKAPVQRMFEKPLSIRAQEALPNPLSRGYFPQSGDDLKGFQ